MSQTAKTKPTPPPMKCNVMQCNKIISRIIAGLVDIYIYGLLITPQKLVMDSYAV